LYKEESAMNAIDDHRESLGKRLGILTRDALEAQRVAEERAEAARVQAEREMLVRVRGEDLFLRCAEEAERAAREGFNFVTTRLPVSSDDVLLHLEIGQYVVAELIRCGCRAEMHNEELSEETKFFRVQIGWDVAVISDPSEAVPEPSGPIPDVTSQVPMPPTKRIGAVSLTKKLVPARS
jgi:hypothetical protein